MYNFNFQINNLGCPDNQIRYGDHCYSSLFQPITQSCISNGKICDGDDLTTVGNTADTAQCQEFCQGTEGCLYWVYDTVTRNCDYKNADMTDKCTDGGTANKYSGPQFCAGVDIYENANACFDLGGLLWYPETANELHFVNHKWPANGALYHLGYKNYTKHWGIQLMDGHFLPGIPFYTRKSFYTIIYHTYVIYKATFYLKRTIFPSCNLLIIFPKLNV